MTQAQIVTKVTEEDLSSAKGQATKALNESVVLKIVKPVDMEEASDLLSKVALAKKIITARRKYYTDPISEGLKRIRDTYKPIELKLAEADENIREKMKDYDAKVQEENRKKEKEIADKVESGDMSMSEGSKAIEKKTVSVKTEKVTFRTVNTVKIVDDTLLPREYLMPDMPKIKADAFKKVIPGVEIVEERIPVVK